LYEVYQRLDKRDLNVMATTGIKIDPLKDIKSAPEAVIAGGLTPYPMLILRILNR
jgi:hypothetical protein